MSESSQRQGEIIAARYQLDEPIGQGGMATVYAARHLELDEKVAIKILHRSLTTDSEAVKRFMREARLLFRLNTEHATRILDLGKTESGTPFMVMEYLSGRDLEKDIQDRGNLPTRTAISYTLQVCDALAEAHALGIIHRDIKPSNLFLTQSVTGRSIVKVLDFGIAKADLFQQTTALTRVGLALGSPLFMSPEQVRNSSDVDQRTDIWSLGVLLYYLISGKHPFAADSIHDILSKIVRDEPTPIQTLCPNLSEGIIRTIDGCLVKDRYARTPTVGALAKELLPFITGETVTSRSVISRQRKRVELNEDQATEAGVYAVNFSHRSIENALTEPLEPTVQAMHIGSSSSQSVSYKMIAIAGLIAVATFAILVLFFPRTAVSQKANQFALRTPMIAIPTIQPSAVPTPSTSITETNSSASEIPKSEHVATTNKSAKQPHSSHSTTSSSIPAAPASASQPVDVLSTRR